MKEKVAVAWRRETKTIGRNPEIVNRFSKRIEEEIRATITKEKITDPKMMKTLRNLKKAQKEQKVVFRQTDKSKVFHLGKPETYIEKSAQYMSKMNAYKEIEQSPLEDMIKSTEELLIDLVRRKLLPAKYLEKLRPSRKESESELPHLYYNPKDHKIGEPLRPIVAGIKSPVAKISSFLDQILRPIFDKVTPYNLTDSINLLNDLKTFQTNEKTKLYTFDITDLYTSIPQHEAVMAICEMLGTYNIRKVKNEIPINTIRILLKHVLNNSFFTLQLPGQAPKFFQQIRGGPMGLACTQVLADVYTIYEQLATALGPKVPSYPTVTEWAKRFREGREDVNDDPRSGRPVSELTDQNIKLVREVITNDPHSTYDDIIAETFFSHGTIERIIHDCLKIKTNHITLGTPSTD
ncbi:unnamed protein product [Rotaria sp. Silwood2]|nr:unnamed protein product [Rotaria sp. Silwood2]